MENDDELSDQDVEDIEGIFDELDEEELEYELNRKQIAQKLHDSKSIIQRIKCLSDDFKIRFQAELTSKKGLKGFHVRNDTKSSYIALLIFGIKHKIEFDPILLANEIGLLKKDLNACLKIVAGNDTKKKPEFSIPVHIFHPRSFIRTFVHQFGYILPEDVGVIADKVDEFYEKYRLFLESANPRHVLAYVVKKYYTSERDPPLDKVPNTESSVGPFSKVSLKEVEQIVLNDLTEHRIKPDYSIFEGKEEKKKKPVIDLDETEEDELSEGSP